MRSLKKLVVPAAFALTSLAGLASNALAATYPINWLQMAPTPFGSTVPNNSTFFLPGVGNVQVVYSLPPAITETRLLNSFIASGSISSGGNNYTWSNFESFATIFTAGGNPLVPLNWRITYIFPTTLPAGSIYLGVSGLGQTTSFGGGASIASCNHNGTFLGDWSGAGGPWGPTQFNVGPPFTMKNSVNGAGGADPWWNTPLGVVRIDDAMNTLTVDMSQIRGDGVGLNIGYSAPQNGQCPVECPPQSQVQICYEAGRVDNYALPYDPTTPRPFFASLLSTYAISKPFDDPRVNAVCGTSFQNLPCGITSATLEIQMRAENDIPQNDSIYLQWLGSGFAWASPINALPGAGGTWNAGQQQTFTLNLGSLPGGLLAQMNLTHALDLLVSDDTTVEHARLTITACPCDGPARVYTVGTVDNMASPTEPTSRRARLSALRTVSPFLWKDNDDCTIDRGWGNTFTNLPSGIVKADFNIRMKPCAGGASNDGLSFDLLNLGAPETFSRGFNINTLPGAGAWTSTPLTNFYFNLGSTLPTTVCGSNLLGDFGDRTFDVYVQDDSGIDAARLRVWPCPPLQRIIGNPIELTGSAQLAQNSAGQVTVTNLAGSGNDGVAFDAHGSEGQLFTFTPGTFSQLTPGTEVSILLEADVTGDGERSGLSAGKVSISSFNVMRVAPGPNGTGTCTGIHIRNKTTGERLNACISDGQELQVNSTELSAIGWGDHSGGGGGGAGTPIHHNLHMEFQAPVDVVLPDGRRFRGDSIDFDDNDLNQGAAIDVCSFSWGVSQGHYNGPASAGFARVATTVNGVSHECVGPNAALNPNPSSLTVSNIGSSGQDGVEIKWRNRGLWACSSNVTPVCGNDLTAGCVDTLQNLNVVCRGTYADGGTSDASVRMTGRISSFFDIFCDFSAIGSPLSVATVLDGSGAPVGTFFIDLGLGLHVVSNGIGYSSVSCDSLTVNGKSSPKLALAFENDVAFGVSGRRPVTGRSVVFSPAQAARSLTDIEGVRITGSGMSELDFSGQTIVPPAGAPCPADFNQDGGVDGADVSAFFDAWENGQPEADVNQDGGVDGDDVSTFFAAWENGGC